MKMKDEEEEKERRRDEREEKERERRESVPRWDWMGVVRHHSHSFPNNKKKQKLK